MLYWTLLLLGPVLARVPHKSHPEPLIFGLAESVRNPDSGWVTETYLSSPLPLSPGEVAFTDISRTDVQVFSAPAGTNVSIKTIMAEIVDENNQSVPLDEVYFHHWIFIDPTSPNSGACGPDRAYGDLIYKFGIGAEARLSPQVLPEKYVVTSHSKIWHANLHMMRTVGLDESKGGVKGCIECSYAAGKGCSAAQSGSFPCCMDGSKCPVQADLPPALAAPKTYFVRYKVEWKEFDPAEDIPVDIYLFDASDCQVEFNVKDDHGTGVSVVDRSWPVTMNSTLVYAIAHMHIGMINSSLYYQPVNSSKWVLLCTFVPTYGTEVGVPGNEKGYVVRINSCDVHQQRQGLLKGDLLRTVSVYNVGKTDTRTWNVGPKEGVMAFMYVALAPGLPSPGLTPLELGALTGGMILMSGLSIYAVVAYNKRQKAQEEAASPGDGFKALDDLAAEDMDYEPVDAM